MTNRSHRVGRGVASIVTLVVLLVGVPIGLAAVARSRFGVANPLGGVTPPWRWQIDSVGDTLSAPLRDDTVIDLLVRSSLVLIWIALIVIAVTTVSETIHLVRHRGMPAPHVRGLGWAQGIGRWVAIGLVALLPINSFGSGANAGSDDTGPVATAQRLGVERSALAADPTAFAVDNFGTDTLDARTSPSWESTGDWSPPEAGVHVVQRGESIYAIAAEYAGGDDSRTIEVADAILDLNLENVMSDGQRFTNPALIQPGWMLRLPAGVGVPDPSVTDRHLSDDDPTPVRGIPRIDLESIEDRPVTHVVVEPGDTLSSIAEEHLGSPDDWPLVWERNRGHDMDDGRTFDDPHTIVPGWELELPGVPGDIEAEAQTTSRGGTRSDPTATVSTSPPPTTEGVAPATSTSDTDTSTSDTSVPTSTPVPTTSASTTVPVAPDVGDAAGGADSEVRAPRAPTPIRIEHAGLLAAGVLTLVAVRRRRALRAALPHARVPPPPPDIAATERRLRTVDPGERAARIDIAVRAAAHHIVETGVRIGTVCIAPDGALTLRLTGDAPLAAPWTGSGASWSLPASVPIEMLGDDARRVGQPCLALVTVGIDSDGRDVLIDLEAAGLTTVEARPDQADEIVRAIGSGLATSLDSEVVHLVVASLGAECLFDHPNAREVDSAEAAVQVARSLVASTQSLASWSVDANERTSFELRTRRTGGEMWEPAIALLASDDRAVDLIDADTAPPGRGVALVVASAPGHAVVAAIEPGARIVGHADRWKLSAFGDDVDLSPIGITVEDVADVDDMLADAARPVDAKVPRSFEMDDPVADPLRPTPHDIVVGLMGSVTIRSTDGTPGRFERSKTIELIAWLATHRDRATRAAARTALWEMDVRDATFANVVSEARRALGRLVAPPGGEEWLARTLNETLPLHERVVTDADLIEHRVHHARLAPPAHAIDVLRPAVAMIRGMPFEGTSYLWPDADGLTSSLVLLATTAAAELAGHALSIGDTDLVFWATGQGLKVLPGHEELIGLRMRAHARAGDLAGVRQEWESYERVIMADAWSDGDPAPKLLSLRRELLKTK